MVYSGLMDADDELMQSAALYFREGPNTKAYNINGNAGYFTLAPLVLEVVNVPGWPEFLAEVAVFDRVAQGVAEHDPFGVGDAVANLIYPCGSTGAPLCWWA